MPGLAVFAAPAQIGLGIDPAHLHPGHAADGKRRRQGDIESAVSVKQRGIGAVELHAFFTGDEHRHARAVFALIKNLFDFIILRFDFRLGPAEQAALTRGHVVAIDARRRGETGEHVKRLDVGPLARKTHHRADAGKLHVADKAAVDGKNFHLRQNVLQIRGDKPVGHKTHLRQRAFGLRNYFPPIRPLGLAQINGNQPAARGIEVGFKKQHRSVVAHISIFVVEVVDYLHRHRVHLGQILDGYAVAIRAAQFDGYHQVSAVVRNFAAI